MEARTATNTRADRRGTQSHALRGCASRLGGAVFLGLIVAACPSGQPEPDAPSVPSTAGAAPEQPERPEAPERVFRSRAPSRPDGFDRLESQVEDAGGGWQTEALAARVARLLEREFGELLEDPSAPDWADLLADGFAGSTVLRPASLEKIFDDGVLVVHRATQPESELGDARALGSQLTALAAPFGGARDARVVVDVESVVEGGSGRFDTSARVRLSGALGTGRQQVNLLLASTWSLPDAAGAPRIESLRLEGFEDVRFAHAPFAELTQHVLGGTPFFARDIHLGSVEYLRRQDRLASPSRGYLGMHGAAVGDVNGDGLEDLYVAQTSGVPNGLFLQQPDGSVHDAAAAAGVDFLDHTQGVLILDLNGDGARDLILALGPDLCVAWNAGDGTFPESEMLRGKGDRSIYSISSADADGDGDLDLYATRYSGAEPPTPYNDAQNGVPNMFWRNEGARFRLATREAGFDVNNTRFSLASLWEDLDGDGDLDLYVTNDFGQNNFFRNDEGYFTDVAGEAGLTDMAASMGVACADVDRDGHLDLYVSNMYSAPGMRVTGQGAFMPTRSAGLRESYARHARGNTLFLGRGDGTFEDATGRSGAARGGWTWGAIFTDYDNDGLPDLYVPNGFLTGVEEADVESFSWRSIISESPEGYDAQRSYREGWDAGNFLVQSRGYSWNGYERNFAYWNAGSHGFVDVSAATGLDYLDDGRVACTVDWDGDGRLDLWLKNRTAPLLRFLHNRHAAGGHWISFELADEGPNTEAVGALVSLRAGEHTYRKRVYAGDTYLGSSSRRLHFGLGSAERVAGVSVTWPGGEVEHFEELAADQVWTLRRGAGAARASEVPARPLGRAGGAKLPSSSLARRAAGPSAERAPRSHGRVPLLEALPFSMHPLPRFDVDPSTVSEYRGRVLYLPLWASWDAASCVHLEQLAAGHDRLQAAGVELYPISLDRVRDEPYVRATLEGLGWSGPTGRANKRLRGVWEMLLWHILGPSEDYGVPLGLLFDRRGSLCCIYVGGAQLEQLEADARAVAADTSLSAGRWPVGLTGGRWLERGPERDLDGIRAALRSGGFKELEKELEGVQALRAAAGSDAEGPRARDRDRDGE